MGNNPIEKFFNYRFRNNDKYENKIVSRMAAIARDFHPDVVHIWGLENFYAQIIEHISELPTVVHIQGLTCAYSYAYLPPRFNYKDIKSADSWINRILFNRGLWTGFKSFEKRAQNEIRLSKFVKNWIGRTEWDKIMGEILNPSANYFHCDEMMRSDFGNEKWKFHYDGNVMHLQSAISMEWYKGFDVILKTAEILKLQGVNICWHVYGWTQNNNLIKMFVKRTGIQPEDVGIICHGHVDGATIKDGLLRCDAYIHPSYIENSSNAIAEAQLLGVPVIAHDVGGNKTMLRDESGILVPPNEPYILAAKITSLRNQKIAEKISQKAYDITRNRHESDAIVNNLTGIYYNVINNQNL